MVHDSNKLACQVKQELEERRKKVRSNSRDIATLPVRNQPKIVKSGREFRNGHEKAHREEEEIERFTRHIDTLMILTL